MDRFRRIYQLHQILRSHRYPVARKTLEEKLDCSRPTVKRIIQEMRLFLDAPIEYDRAVNGYHYAETGEHPYELPGLWFNASELHALLATQELLTRVQPGLLDGLLAPFRKRIEEILASDTLGSGEVARRVRILQMAARNPSGEYFQTVSGALLQRRRLFVTYLGRGRNDETTREISPQRLVHYRDNWYLDAWCHRADGLRTFALERIRQAKTLEKKAREIPDAKLDSHFAGSYGIFAGKPKHVAVLRFTPERARWVAEEQWHPQQSGKFLEDGSYELAVPYSDPRELVLDILKYGPDVEVMAPDMLRSEVADRLDKAARRYRRTR